MTDRMDLLEVRDPATLDLLSTITLVPAGEAQELLRRASAAQPDWSAHLEKRRAAIQAMADGLRGEIPRISRLLSQEQGKPLTEAIAECTRAADWLEFFSALAMPFDSIASVDGLTISMRRRALGVVVGITPWNFPVSIAIHKLAPALLAGNCVIIKPSPFAPLSPLALRDIFQPLLPEGVLQFAVGGADLGAALIEDPLCARVSFTGSTASGRIVGSVAGGALKPMTLELGGNDPAIVLDDVKASEVAEQLVAGAFANNGQLCVATKRLYVPARRYREFVDALSDIVKGLKVGIGLEPDTQLGPVNNRSQMERVDGLVLESLAMGARVAGEGLVPDLPGYFVPPRVVADAAHGMRLVDEEQFGPALPILSYRDVEEAVAMANASEFGLTASVWSHDLALATEVGDQLEVGSVSINSVHGNAPFQPFPMAKSSGVGIDNGKWALEANLQSQVERISSRAIQPLSMEG